MQQQALAREHATQVNALEREHQQMSRQFQNRAPAAAARAPRPENATGGDVMRSCGDRPHP
jgi:hypothetical protein